MKNHPKIITTSSNVTTNTENITKFFNSGIELLNQNKFNQALIYFNRVLILAPDHILSWVKRGITYFHLKNVESAIYDFQQGLRLKPFDLEMFEWLLYSLIELKRYDEALRQANILLSFNPNVIFALLDRGVACTYLGDDEQAIIDFTQVLTISTQGNYRNRALFKRGSILFNKGKYQEAVNDFNEYLQTDPKNIIALQFLTNAWINLGNFHNALSILLLRMELEPESLEVRYSLGKTYFKLEDYVNAIINFNEVLKINPQDTRAIGLRADSFYLQGKFLEAINDYNSILSLPKYQVLPQMTLLALNKRGLIFTSQGRYRDAAYDFNAALKIHPKHTPTLVNLANNYLKQGKLEDALHYYNKAVECVKDDTAINVYYGRGNIHLQLRNYEEALEDYKHALYFCPHDETILQQIDKTRIESHEFFASSGNTKYLHKRNGSEIIIDEDKYLPSPEKPSGRFAITRFFTTTHPLKPQVIIKQAKGDYKLEIDLYRNEFQVWNLFYPEQPAKWLEFEHHDFRLMLPRLPGIMLKDFIKQTSLTITQYLQIYLAIANELNKLHQLGYVHCDFKPDNVLIHMTSELKSYLIDFGHASPINSKKHTLLPHLKTKANHLPPEIFTDEVTEIKITVEYDIFSFCKYMIDYNSFPIPPELNQMLKRGISVNPSERPSFAYIIQSFEENIYSSSATSAVSMRTCV